jgi:hypothetical protein
MIRILRRREPDTLRNTASFVGRPNIDDILKQLEKTRDQDTPIGRLFSTREGLAGSLSNISDGGWEQFPSVYSPQGDFAILPEGSPGVALHELGHAIDLNKSLRYNEDGSVRSGRHRKAIRSRLKPVLIAEHDAWRKGMGTLAKAVENKKEEDFARRILEEAYKRKKPALGTYWGGGIGAVLGAAGGAAAGFPIDLPIAGSMLGSIGGVSLGVPIGAAIGKAIATDSRAERYADKMLRKNKSK